MEPVERTVVNDGVRLMVRDHGGVTVITVPGAGSSARRTKGSVKGLAAERFVLVSPASAAPSPSIRQAGSIVSARHAREREQESEMERLLGELSYGSVVNRRVFDGQSLLSVRTRQLWFDRCSFVGTDLRHATLDGCSFKMCDLRGADLRGASLRGARITGCDLREADLRYADLTGARLGYVNTGIAPYGRSDVTGARLTHAVLRDLQLDQVIGWPE